MFCSKCGAVIEEGTAFCAVCGTKVGGPAVTVTGAPAGTTSGKAPSSGAPKGLGIASLVCGILAAVGEFFGYMLPVPLPILPLTIAAIVTGAVSKSKSTDRNQERSGLAVAGMTLGISAASIYMIEWVVSTIVSTILAIVSMIISAIVSILMILLYVAIMAVYLGIEAYM